MLLSSYNVQRHDPRWIHQEKQKANYFSLQR